MENELPNSSEFLQLTEDERSILMLEWMRVVIINQTNHIKHHWAITLVSVAAGLTGLINLGIAFIIIFFRIKQ